MQSKLSSGLLAGTAILVHKRLVSQCVRVSVDNPRITAIRCKIRSHADLVFASLYLPWNDRSVEQYDEYEEALGNLQGLIDSHIGCNFIFGGDLNVQMHSNELPSLLMRNFSDRNNLLWIEPINGSVDYTYHNDVNAHYSLIDHFLCSPNLVTVSKSAHILVDGDNPSDHWAIYCDFWCSKLDSRHPSCPNTTLKPQWDKANTDSYKALLSGLLSQTCLPIDALTCNGSNCCDHTAVLDAYYTQSPKGIKRYKFIYTYGITI